MVKRAGAAKKGGKKAPVQMHFGVPITPSRPQPRRISPSLVSDVCSLTDPFCPHAAGARLPDTNSTKTIGLAIRHKQIVSVDANGKAALLVRASLTNCFTAHTTITGTAVTTWATATGVTDETAYTDNLHDYRVVSFGVRCFPVQAPTAQQGAVRMITVSDNAPANGYDAGGNLHEAVNDFPLAAPELLWASKPHGNRAAEFNTTSSSATAWDSLVIFVDGATQSAGTDVLAVELYLNIEATPNLGVIGAGLTTPSPASKPALLHARDKVMQDTGGAWMSSVWDFGKRVMSSAATSLANVAVDMIPGFVGGALRGGRRVGRLANGPIEVD